MSNLLWKFLALAGVAGVGFMVVLQTMESMQVKPQHATAAVPGQAPELSPPPVPPLKIQKSVSTDDPFAGGQKPEPEPVPSANPFDAESFSQLAANDHATQAEAMPGFPAFPAPQDRTEVLEPESEVPDLPVMIPTTPEAEEAVSEPTVAENPFGAPPNLLAQAPPPPLPPEPKSEVVASEDPFSDPVPPPNPEPQESEPTTVPFDPYESLPKDSEPQLASSPAEESTQNVPLLIPPAPADPKKPEGESSSEPDSPVAGLPAFPEPVPTVDVAAKSQPEPAPQSKAPAKTAEVPQFPEFFEQSPKTTQTPGRASVQIPLAPPALDEPFNEPPTLALDQTTEGSSSAVIPVSENAPPELVESAPSADDPVNVPLAGPAEAAPEPSPAAEVDPLDQLTFPDAAPPVAEAPPTGFSQTPPEPAAPETGSAPIQAQTAPGGELHFAVPAGPIEGVGELNQLVPAGPQQPELKIEKTAPPKAVLGQPMIYHILVRNVGASAAHQVIVEDQVPKGTQLTGTIPRGEMADNRLIWRLGVIQPGEEKKIAVRVIPIQEGQIGSVAKVSFVAEVAAKTVVASPKIELEFTGPSKAVLGDAVTFHFKMANTGTGDASNVFLRNILPEGLNHPDGNDLEYEVGVLKAGEVREIDLTVNATKAGEFTNKAVISASGNLKTEADVKVKIIGDRIVITRTGPKRRYVGRTASYSNTITNQTDSTISPVHVVEAIPPGMDFVQAGSGGTFDPQKRTVTWAIPELGPNRKQVLQLDLLARQAGPQTSEVVAYDPNGTRAMVKSETTVEGYAVLRLDVGDYEDAVDVGDEVGLRIIAANKGTKASRNVIVKAIIPAEMEFVSAKGPVDFKRDGATLTFEPVETLPAQEELAFDLVLRSVKPGDSRVELEIAASEMSKPLNREEAVRILPNRP